MNIEQPVKRYLCFLKPDSPSDSTFFLFSQGTDSDPFGFRKRISKMLKNWELSRGSIFLITYRYGN
jgi:hypothetical protein